MGCVGCVSIMSAYVCILFALKYRGLTLCLLYAGYTVCEMSSRRYSFALILKIAILFILKSALDIITFFQNFKLSLIE